MKKKWIIFVECPPPPWEVVEAKDTKNKIYKAKFCWSGKPLEEYKIPALTVFVAFKLWRRIREAYPKTKEGCWQVDCPDASTLLIRKRNLSYMAKGYRYGHSL